MSMQRELARLRRVRQAIREASGDLVWIVEGRAREMIDRFWMQNLVNPEQPRWKRVGYKRYEWKTPSGALQVSNCRGAWFVCRDGVMLVHAPDGRDAIFLHRWEAETAAVMHLRDGQDNHRQIDDELCWEPDEELPLDPEDELSWEPEEELCREPEDEPCWEHDELCSEPEEEFCGEPEFGT
jgi:hypothetical protein